MATAFSTRAIVAGIITLAALAASSGAGHAAPPSSGCSDPLLRKTPLCDFSLPPSRRAAGFVALLSLDEKISQLVNSAPGVARLGLPAYQWWSEALHGVMSACAVTNASSSSPSSSSSSSSSPTSSSSSPHPQSPQHSPHQPPPDSLRDSTLRGPTVAHRRAAAPPHYEHPSPGRSLGPAVTSLPPNGNPASPSATPVPSSTNPFPADGHPEDDSPKESPSPPNSGNPEDHSPKENLSLSNMDLCRCPTIYPMPLALAASFNLPLVHAAARQIAAEARAMHDWDASRKVTGNNWEVSRQTSMSDGGGIMASRDGSGKVSEPELRLDKAAPEEGGGASMGEASGKVGMAGVHATQPHPGNGKEADNREQPPQQQPRQRLPLRDPNRRRLLSTRRVAGWRGQVYGRDVWSPNINIFRDPRWGRGQETPGECPYLTSEYAVAYISGIQGDGYLWGGRRGLLVGEGGVALKEGVMRGGEGGDDHEEEGTNGLGKEGVDEGLKKGPNGRSKGERDGTRQGRLIATAKHFAVYNLENWKGVDRHHFDAVASPRDLAQTYLVAFEAAVRRARVGSIMCAYNKVNGVPACAHRGLLEETLREAWGFAGYVVSDCDAEYDMAMTHHWSGDLAEAAASSLRAGTDLDCGGTALNLPSAIQRGLADESDVDRAVVRLFIARVAMGLFDPAPAEGAEGEVFGRADRASVPLGDDSPINAVTHADVDGVTDAGADVLRTRARIDTVPGAGIKMVSDAGMVSVVGGADMDPVPDAGIDVIGCELHRRTAHELARQSLVLLKNEAGRLPLVLAPALAVAPVTAVVDSVPNAQGEPWGFPFPVDGKSDASIGSGGNAGGDARPTKEHATGVGAPTKANGMDASVRGDRSLGVGRGEAQQGREMGSDVSLLESGEKVLPQERGERASLRESEAGAREGNGEEDLKTLGALSVALVGPFGNVTEELLGNYWDGHAPIESLLDALARMLARHGGTVSYEPGCGINDITMIHRESVHDGGVKDRGSSVAGTNKAKSSGSIKAGRGGVVLQNYVEEKEEDNLEDDEDWNPDDVDDSEEKPEDFQDEVSEDEEKENVKDIQDDTQEEEEDDDIRRAAALAATSDITILALGLGPTVEAEELDRETLTLPGRQQKLLEAVAAAAPRPVVVVLVAGSGVDVSWAKGDARVGAILQAVYPGQEAAGAIAEAIFGEFSPSGRLPITVYPASFADAMPMTDERMRSDPGHTYRFYEGEAVYPFGAGLSYVEDLVEYRCSRSTRSTSRCRMAGQVHEAGAMM
eukprot:jgi/Mesvir1/388/Mv11280-RA.2